MLNEGDECPLLKSSENESRRNAKGINWIVAAAFIVADVAGGGIIAIPNAFLTSGNLFGLVMVVFVGVCFCYTGHLLGECWIIMQRRWPQYRNHCRKPYPELAFRSLGKWSRLLTNVVLDVMLFGVAIVYLLLSSRILNDLIGTALGWRLGECRLLVFLCSALLPILMLGSPQDFWMVVIGAMVTTLMAAVMILLGIRNDWSTCQPVSTFPLINRPIFSMGIFAFGFGGHGVFPSIINEMKFPQQFTRSSVVAFSVVALLYLPIAFLAVMVYGDSLSDSVISSIQNDRLRQTANLFVAAHCLLTLTIVINPLSMELEYVFSIPHAFGWRRFFLRSVLVASIGFSALSFPSFGPILNLIGGTAIALTSAVLPSLFHLSLCATDGIPRREWQCWRDWLRIVCRKTSTFRLVINFTVIFVAIICGVSTTHSALMEIGSHEFGAACYSSGYKAEVADAVKCCGHFGNVSAGADCSISK